MLIHKLYNINDNVIMFNNLCSYNKYCSCMFIWLCCSIKIQHKLYTVLDKC